MKISKIYFDAEGFVCEHPLVEALEQMSTYVKFMNELIIKERIVSFQLMDNVNHCSKIAFLYLVKKKEYPRAFKIPCIIGSSNFSRALYDLGTSSNLVPLVIYK